MGRIVTAGVLGLFLLASVPAWADCRGHQQTAMAMIADAKQTAERGGRLDSNDFMSRFRPLVDRMTQERCTAELLGIMQHVNAERGALGMPVTH